MTMWLRQVQPSWILVLSSPCRHPITTLYDPAVGGASRSKAVPKQSDDLNLIMATTTTMTMTMTTLMAHKQQQLAFTEVVMLYLPAATVRNMSHRDKEMSRYSLGIRG